jgi:peroxiredoxin
LSEKLKIGDEAPNFDLTSTEDVLLMLRDEVPRVFVVLYFFGDPTQEPFRGNLATLEERRKELLAQQTVPLGISATKMPILKETQKDLHLVFPLLNDDRNFAASYGIESPEEGEPKPALFLVGRDQRILWEANPSTSIETGLDEILAIVQKQPSQTANLPSTVVNRVVDWWVNRVRGARVAER